jgi:hypothetical protein
VQGQARTLQRLLGGGHRARRRAAVGSLPA